MTDSPDRRRRRLLSSSALLFLALLVLTNPISRFMIDQRPSPRLIARMFEAAPMVWFSIVPTGILYPVGLMTLGVTLFAARPVPRWIGALLFLGALLFPVGRIGRAMWAIVASDLLLGTTFALLGFFVWSGGDD